MVLLVAAAALSFFDAATDFNSDPNASYAVDFERFPGYGGPLNVSGIVKVEGSSTQQLYYQLVGFDPDCPLGWCTAGSYVDGSWVPACGATATPNSCGLHIHSSLDGTCAEGSVGGHYYSVGAVGADPWTTATYAHPAGATTLANPWRFPGGEEWNPSGGSLLTNNPGPLTIETCPSVEGSGASATCSGATAQVIARRIDSSNITAVQVDTGLTLQQATTGVLVLHDRSGVKIACSPIAAYSAPPSPPPPPSSEFAWGPSMIVLVTFVSLLALVAVVGKAADMLRDGKRAWDWP